MPRAIRFFLPGHVYHLTHRCHDRAWLLKYASDRKRYRKRLREALKEFKVSLLNYCITCNHAHLLAVAHDAVGIPALMQAAQSRFAEDYNRRHKRCGAFWSDRYRCTMIESGTHLWNCTTYIDLNMVRAGAVSHPRDWRWCGYDELTGRRSRYCLLDKACVAEYLGGGSLDGLKDAYDAAIAQALERGRLEREPQWTEPVIVGGRQFAESMAIRVKRGVRVEMAQGPDGIWTVREERDTYGKWVRV